MNGPRNLPIFSFFEVRTYDTLWQPASNKLVGNPAWPLLLLSPVVVGRVSGHLAAQYE